ncbi:glutathione peroxidase [Sabulilitoribacter multivorans]|uniref:Glutathione peroxidase n=1 Tax=Flaviramulus multivorans TaxID=1304750 RepID=A0ABS9IMS4_9FLAO|nr:glutathione peroxidase [Flaviramulus multivorans]MCF7561863.1 glutathione peroxidase [Flaviramulus multivorans]
MNPLTTFLATLFSKSKQIKMNVNSIYDIQINSLQGKPIQLSEFKGKYILFVNVASECGFTPQYKAMQELHEAYKDKLQVIGVPCNQFGGQEPGDSDTIKSFCEVNYGVTFLITEKIDVKGKNQHPLYTWLTQKINNGSINSEVKWNFQKYLVDTNGNLINYYLSSTNPLSQKIIKHLK